MGLFIENGLNTRFWEDTWLGSAPMPQHYPTLHVIAQQKGLLVVNVMSNVPQNIGFRRP
jgi:hypothetical protein